MDICAIADADKKLLARRIGADLVRQYGKKQHYSVQQVKASARRRNFPDTWDCWALSMYTSPVDFAEYHYKTGEVCDYASMQAKMIEAAALDLRLPEIVDHVPSTDVQGAESLWFSHLLDVLANIDLPDIDLPNFDP